MAWSGGTYTRTNGVFSGSLVWTDDRDALTKITAAHHDTHDQDLAQGINACLNKNGQNSPTANIDWGGFKITNLSAGTADTDSARTAQTITAASIDSASKILTLTRSDGDVTVDLTPIVVAGDTSDFARLSLSDNNFVGKAEFGGNLSAFGKLILAEDSLSSGDTWVFESASPTLMTLRPSFGGVQFNFVRNVSIAAGGTFQVGGYDVWHTGTFDPTGLVKATDNATITGNWAFTGTSLQTPSSVVIPIVGGGSSWTLTAQDDTLITLTPLSPGGVISFVSNATLYAAGSTVLVNDVPVWDRASWKVSGTSPAGGFSGDVWLVTTGTDKGLWTNIAGTWTKIL